MNIIGKLDLEIYNCISTDTITDELIITESQLKHMQSEHPDAYDKINQYLEATLMDPDYIFSDKHENTGMVVRQIDVESENVALVLRVCTSKDTSGYKNSIISGWIISEKRLQNYLRNRKILYKKRYMR